MQLVDLKTHFSNCNVDHYERQNGWAHDVYINRKNGKKFTIPINENDLPDPFCYLACSWLGIEGINGEPHHTLLPLEEYIKNHNN